MNHPFASETSAIGTRQLPEAVEGDGDGTAGAGEKADSDGDGDGLGATGDAIVVGLAVAMDPASCGTAPQAARITQQSAANATRFACISLISNVAVETWCRDHVRLCSSASP
jgi:hypothetical protein